MALRSIYEISGLCFLTKGDLEKYHKWETGRDLDKISFFEYKIALQCWAQKIG